MKTWIKNICLAWACAVFSVVTSSAQSTTAFTYQGQLRDGGANANGIYTLVFKLYDAATNGNQISTALTNSPTLTNGLFTVALDFGAGAFNGSARWLDITITNGNSQTLTPRVQVLATPYAQFAATAGSVTNGAITDAAIATNSSLVQMMNENNLVIIRGTLNSSGTAVLGSGYTVTITGSNTRTINFTQSFSNIPTVTLGQHGSSGTSIVDIVTSTAASFSTIANGAAGFDFIAIGPR